MPVGKRSVFWFLAAAILLLAGAFFFSVMQAKQPMPPAAPEQVPQLPPAEAGTQPAPPNAPFVDQNLRIRQLTQQLENAQAELAAARERLAVEKQAAGDKLREEINALRRASDELAAKLAASDAAQKETEKALEQARSRRAALARELDNAEKATEQATQQTEEAKKQSEKLMAELAEAKTAADEATKVHETTLKDVQSKLDTANAKILELTKEIAALKTAPEAGSPKTEQPEESGNAVP